MALRTAGIDLENVKPGNITGLTSSYRFIGVDEQVIWPAFPCPRRGMWMGMGARIFLSGRGMLARKRISMMRVQLFFGAGQTYLITAAGLEALDAADGTIDQTIDLGTTAPYTINVEVDDQGDGTVVKDGVGTDAVESVESFVAGEAVDEIDEITITPTTGVGFTTDQIAGIDTDAEDGQTAGTFTPFDGTAIAFGPDKPLKYDDIINGIGDGTFAKGEFQITSGDESGSVGGISFENFETINFAVVCFARGTQIKNPCWRGQGRGSDCRR